MAKAKISNGLGDENLCTPGRHADLGFGVAGLAGPHDELGAVAGVQLGQDVGDVVRTVLVLRPRAVAISWPLRPRTISRSSSCSRSVSSGNGRDGMTGACRHVPDHPRVWQPPRRAGPLRP